MVTQSKVLGLKLKRLKVALLRLKAANQDEDQQEEFEETEDEEDEEDDDEEDEDDECTCIARPTFDMLNQLVIFYQKILKLLFKTFFCCLKLFLFLMVSGDSRK